MSTQTVSYDTLSDPGAPSGSNNNILYIGLFIVVMLVILYFISRKGQLNKATSDTKVADNKAQNADLAGTDDIAHEEIQMTSSSDEDHDEQEEYY